MLSCHLHVSDPEKLSDQALVVKLRQLEWLASANHLSTKLKDGARLLPDILTNYGQEDY